MDDKPLDQDAIDALLRTTGKSSRPSRGGGRTGGGDASEPPRPPRRVAKEEPDDDGPAPDENATADVNADTDVDADADVDVEVEVGVELPPATPMQAPSPGEVYKRISKVPVEIAVVLGDLEMPISEVLRLKPGTVVQLDAWVDTPVEIRMRGRTVARAQIVTLDDTYALRIVENLIAAPDFPTG